MMCAVGISQTDSALARDASGRELLRLGKNAMKQDDPESAISFYGKYVKQKPHDARGYYHLGNAYAESRDYVRAKHSYLRAYSLNKEKVPAALFYHAQMQKAVGRYDSARLAFVKFRKEYKGNQRKLKRQALKEIAFCDSLDAYNRSKKNLVVHRLDTSINKLNAEGAALAINDSTLLFVSLRTDKIEFVEEGDTTNISRQRIYFATKNRSGKWVFAGEYGFNDPRYHTGNPSLSADRKRLYFTRCRENIIGEMKCAIFVAERDGNKWKAPVKLPRPINLRKYSSTMPAVAADPKKGNEIIYFVSNKKRGRGGYDIWYTTYDKKLRGYKATKNLGSKVNSSGDEITPFFDHDTRTLYFSSDGHSGFGGLDLYKTIGDGRRIMGIENLGLPINTGADELYYSIAPHHNGGFFASNRKTDRKTDNSTCCDDIYSFTDLGYVEVTLAGKLVDQSNNKLPVEDASIDIYIRDVNHDRVLLRTVKSDSLGRYVAKLETGQDYEIVTRKKEFLSSTDSVSTKGLTRATQITRQTAVPRKSKDPVVIPNFQYEFGRTDLTPASRKMIDLKLIDMMEKNPEIIVEIESHTDSKGNDAYNLKLSQKRAANIVNYIVSKGIDPKRIKGTGHGEALPIAPNENPDGSDNPDGRAKNRRTEFKIIGELSDGY